MNKQLVKDALLTIYRGKPIWIASNSIVYHLYDKKYKVITYAPKWGYECHGEGLYRKVLKLQIASTWEIGELRLYILLRLTPRDSVVYGKATTFQIIAPHMWKEKGERLLGFYEFMKGAEESEALGLNKELSQYRRGLLIASNYESYEHYLGAIESSLMGEYVTPSEREELPRSSQERVDKLHMNQ